MRLAILLVLLSAAPVTCWWNNLFTWAVLTRPTEVTFHKQNGTDQTLAENQDCITKDICLTRAGENGGPMYNIQYFKHKYGTDAPKWVNKMGFYEKDGGQTEYQNTMGFYWGLCEIEGEGWGRNTCSRTSTSCSTNYTVAKLRFTDAVRAKLGSPDNFYDMYTALTLIELASASPNDTNESLKVVGKTSDDWDGTEGGYYWAPFRESSYRNFNEFVRADGSTFNGVSAYHIIDINMCYYIPDDPTKHPSRQSGGHYGTIKFEKWQDGSSDGGEIKYTRSIPKHYYHNRVVAYSWMHWLFGYLG